MYAVYHMTLQLQVKMAVIWFIPPVNYVFVKPQNKLDSSCSSCPYIWSI